MKYEILYALLLGFLLDCLLGDPQGFPHPIVAIGKLIAWLEKRLRRLFPGTKGTKPESWQRARCCGF